MGGGSGGEDVVDQDEVAPGEALGRGGKAEGLLEIRQSLLPRQGRLSVGGQDAGEGLLARKAQFLREREGDFEGLVVAATAEAAAMERHWDQDGVEELPEAVIAAQGLGTEPRKVSP